MMQAHTGSKAVQAGNLCWSMALLMPDCRRYHVLNHDVLHPHAGKPPCLVAVPTHFYKVVLAESRSRLPFGAPKVSVGAFVMPNDQIQPDMPLTAFSVPLEMLENVAGKPQIRLDSVCSSLDLHHCFECCPSRRQQSHGFWRYL